MSWRAGTVPRSLTPATPAPSSSSSLLTHTLGHCEEVRPTTSSLLFHRVRVTEFLVSVEKARRRRRWYRFQRPHGEQENSHSGWHRGTINTETHVPMCSHPQSKRELFICAFCFDLTWPERDNVPTTSRPGPRFPRFLQSIHTQTPFQCVCAQMIEKYYAYLRLNDAHGVVPVPPPSM